MLIIDDVTGWCSYAWCWTGMCHRILVHLFSVHWVSVTSWLAELEFSLFSSSVRARTFLNNFLISCIQK